MPIAVLRAETFYLPPPPRPGRPPVSWEHIPPAERVFAWAESRSGRRVTPPTGSAEQTYYARINHNRWLVDCACGSAQVSSPVDQRSACTECGWGWCAVVYPADVGLIEASLMGEPPHLRNWWNTADPANPVNQIGAAP